MKLSLTVLSLLALSSAARADQACEAFPKCGDYTCDSYLEGKWKDASGAAVEGAYITTEDFHTFQLVKTDDGMASGNPTQVLASCTR